MRITLLHPPHTSIGSRIPRENLPPYGLLCIGGPLIDAGHEVTLINADLKPMEAAEILRRVSDSKPDAVLIGHSGSTTAHPTAVALAKSIKTQHPKVHLIYGGVYPTYHWEDVLNECPELTAIVRGEGESTTPKLMEAIEQGRDLHEIRGIAFRAPEPVATPAAKMIRDLDEYRIGWELIDFSKHSYWGGYRGVIMQFSRGCPHQCTYCGQRGFWTKWRHRDPVKMAREIGRLYRDHDVTLINLADENPTSSPKAWKSFLEAMIAEDVPVIIIGSTRADDIVRDAELLPLYKKAGCLRFLLGLEGTDEATLTTLKKGGTRPKDQEAIKLLRANNMIGLCTFAVGFDEETDADYWRLMKHLLRYDPDQVMSIYATPHRWTPFFQSAKKRRVIDQDLRNWDYKHQVMETTRVPSWRVFMWVKLIEAVLQLRPRALYRCFLHPDSEIRHAMKWYSRMGRRVVLRECWEFLTHWRRPGPTVASYLGSQEQLPENALARTSRTARSEKSLAGSLPVVIRPEGAE